MPAPTKDEASNELIQRVYTPVFFQKLASYPAVPAPRSPEEYEAILTMGIRLRTAHDSGVIKQASQTSSPILNAASRLDDLLTKVAAETGHHAQIDAAVHQLVQDPAIVAASIAWQNHLAADSVAQA